jgi:hypothetical protein
LFLLFFVEVEEKKIKNNEATEKKKNLNQKKIIAKFSYYLFFSSLFSSQRDTNQKNHDLFIPNVLLLCVFQTKTKNERKMFPFFTSTFFHQFDLKKKNSSFYYYLKKKKK